MPEPKIEDFGENLKWKIDHFSPKMGVPKRGEAVYPILQTGSIFKKDRCFFIKNTSVNKNEQKSSFARLLLRSATPLHVQSIIDLSPAAQLRSEHALNH